jgi:hypothetical protein
MVAGDRFLKTNCLWIHYLADILLSKKSFVSSSASVMFKFLTDNLKM